VTTRYELVFGVLPLLGILNSYKCLGTFLKETFSPLRFMKFFL
jgi:hypothetical protein